jgi:anti-sigma-K factor RskA
MTTENEKLNGHEKFKELAASATLGTLSAGERAELKDHLELCGACREVCNQYLILASEGIPLLAARYGYQEEPASWDDMTTRRKLFARVRAAEHQASSGQTNQVQAGVQLNLPRRISVSLVTSAVLAACFVVAVGLAAYRLGSRAQVGVRQVQAYAENHLQNLTAEKKQSVDELLDTQAKKLFHLQQEALQREQELNKLRSALRAAEDSANKLAAANSTANEQLQTVSQQRDTLRGQLRDAEQAYQTVQAELATFRAERDKALLLTASLESRIQELYTANRDQERRLIDDEQYLALDRDIRELMVARKLYIADVFDVDSGSHTRMPFGRVFYTEGKSLLFYAFDLDRQPGLKNASTFQAWGRRETDQGRPLNLGILYMDSESSRRWLLRFDDPKQLAEIDAIFVTVEPHGGSQKPTGKPFLYAMLRKEANHP